MILTCEHFSIFLVAFFSCRLLFSLLFLNPQNHFRARAQVCVQHPFLSAASYRQSLLLSRSKLRRPG